MQETVEMTSSGQENDLLELFLFSELEEIEKIYQYFQFKFSDINLDQSSAQKRANMKKLKAAAVRGHPKAKNYLNFRAIFSTESDSELNDLENLSHTALGFLNSIGVGYNVSQGKALLHFTMAAIAEESSPKGDILAKMIMAYRYYTGISVKSNCETALKYYRQVANFVVKEVTFSGGPAIHRIRLLDEIENSNSVLGTGILDNDLIEFYQLLAHKGDMQAQVGLGQLHYQGGRGIFLDHQKALQYFQLAANGGNAIAMAYLGKIYLEGADTIEQNHELAFKFFQKSAELGNPVGQSGLGVMYLEGRGVPKDLKKAFDYFKLAADQGWVDGQLQLGNMYFTGVGAKKDYKTAHKYFNLASQAGHVLAYYNLGQMYANGLGILPSCPAAVELFKNVAERGKWAENLMFAYQHFKSGQYRTSFLLYAFLAELGYEVAQSNAAFILDKNFLEFNVNSGSNELADSSNGKTKENQIRALQYWSRAANQGYSSAQVKLGDYYYYGWGTEIDYEVAASHYRIASETQHNAQAMFNLGYMHEQGLGMKKDWHLAKRCYDLAAETNADAKIPVALALFKLQFLFKWEAIRNVSTFYSCDSNRNLWHYYRNMALFISITA